MDPEKSNDSPLHSAHSPFNLNTVRASTSNPKGMTAMKRLLHPKYCVNIPPSTGPIDRPIYTLAMFIPIAFPLSLGGYTDVIMARPVTNIIADPTPCKTLNRISEIIDGDTAQRNEDKVKIIIPQSEDLFHSIDICYSSKWNCKNSCC